MRLARAVVGLAHLIKAEKAKALCVKVLSCEYECFNSTSPPPPRVRASIRSAAYIGENTSDRLPYTSCLSKCLYKNLKAAGPRETHKVQSSLARQATKATNTTPVWAATHCGAKSRTRDEEIPQHDAGRRNVDVLVPYKSEHPYIHNSCKGLIGPLLSLLENAYFFSKCDAKSPY